MLWLCAFPDAPMKMYGGIVAKFQSQSFGGCLEEDLSAPPQEPQADPWISQADANARGT